MISICDVMMLFLLENVRSINYKFLPQIESYNIIEENVKQHHSSRHSTSAATRIHFSLFLCATEVSGNSLISNSPPRSSIDLINWRSQMAIRYGWSMLQLYTSSSFPKQARSSYSLEPYGIIKFP